MSQSLGRTCWVVPEGYIPPGSTGTSREFTSHEALCILNTGEQAAQVRLTIYYADRNPSGPYRFEVPARRTRHLRINDLRNPEPVPAGVEYSSVLESDVPVVVQHTRLDSRQSALALLSTIAWSGS
ncbi:MAG TPA: sensory rhodopsin transducer [Steroidobacteraceae bacterium]|nr:sensory rhodopsin transducer [Steroidobacteraceae bacterium]